MKRISFLLYILLSYTTILGQSNSPSIPQSNSTNSKKTEVVPQSLSDTTDIPAESKESITTKNSKYRSAILKNAEEESRISNDKSITSPTAISDSQQKVSVSVAEFSNTYAESSHSQCRRNASEDEQKVLDQNLVVIQQYAPESFEANLYTYQNGRHAIELFSFLNRASKLNPTNDAMLNQLAAYYVITNQSNLADSVIQIGIDKNRFTTGQLIYASQLIESVKPEATLILHGFDDFLPVYYTNNQLIDPIQIISLDLLQSEKYREQIQKLGFELPQLKAIDTSYLEEFCALNADKKLQISLTIPKDYFKTIAEQIVPVGLTFSYSKNLEDNFSINDQLLHSKWNRLKITEKTNDNGDKWAVNYIPMLITLQKQYHILGQIESENEVKGMIELIKKRSQTSTNKSK